MTRSIISITSWDRQGSVTIVYTILSGLPYSFGFDSGGGTTQYTNISDSEDPEVYGEVIMPTQGEYVASLVPRSLI